MIIVFLALLGLAFGSFVNALVWRLRQQERARSLPGRQAGKEQGAKYSISTGRSVCTSCGHKLAAQDLIPIFSWLALGGRCRYCNKPVSWQYPVIELLTAALFVLSYTFWPTTLNLQNLADFVEFGFWLVFLVGFMALIVYDLRWMLLPNRIIFPLYVVAAAGVLVEAILTTDYYLLTTAAAGAAVGGGLFYIIFQASGGKWIGGGDVKLGFLLGIIVGGPWLAFLMLFVASILGTAASLPMIASGKATRTSRIPFGPFLIAAAIIVYLSGQQIIDWYQNYFVIQ